MSNYSVIITDLKKNFGKNEALDKISLKINSGEFFALLGPNGSGKSTTIGILSSLIKKTSGQIKIFDYNLDTDCNTIKSLIGFMPQEYNLSTLESCLAILLRQAGYYGIDKKTALIHAEILLKKLDLWEKKDFESQELSGGEKRRFMLARALIHHPKLLILDEPTAGVDIVTRKKISSLLKDINQSGVTILLTTHNFEEAEELCSHVAFINKGKIILHSEIAKLLDNGSTSSVTVHFNQPMQHKGILTDDRHISSSNKLTITHLQEMFTNNDIPVTKVEKNLPRLEDIFLNLTEEEHSHAAK